MLTLYGTRGSGSASVEAALEIVGVEWTLVDAARWEPSAGFDELLRINPLGQIPTLRLDDGSVLSESAAILIHLGLAHPTSPLLPADPSQRAQAIRGLVWLVANCYAAIGIIDYPERWTLSPDAAVADSTLDEPTVRNALREGTKRRLHELWDLFADQFPVSPWLGGEALGALDILASVVSRWSGARGHLAESRPEFRDLLARIDAHPSVAPVFERHWPLS